jgi:excinuclease ABC subunit B
MNFELTSEYQPTGDQPQAIAQLVEGIQNGEPAQVLLGVTGSGKSLGYDDPVYVVEERGNHRTARVRPIGPLVDEAIRTGQVIAHADHELVDLTGGPVRYFAPAFDPATGRVGLQPVSAFTRHRPTQAMFRVETACGRHATFTADHNFWVLRDGELRLIATADARPTDYLPVPETVPSADGVDTLNALEILGWVSARNLFVETGFRTEGVRVLERQAGLAAKPMSAFHRTPLAAYRAENIPEKTAPAELVLRNRVGRNHLPAQLPLTPSFLRLMGYYVAEGNTQERYVMLANRHPAIRQDLERILGELNQSYRVRASSDYQVSSALLAELLGDQCGRTSFFKKLPPFWPDLSDERLGELLRAYFDGDGYVERGRGVAATTASPQLASDLLYALLRFGIWARMRRVRKQATNSAHAGNWYYQVTISGEADLRRFQRHVGFSLDYKRERLAALLTRPANSNVDVVPIAPAHLTLLRKGVGLSAKALGQRAGLSRPAIHLMEYGQRRPQRSSLRALLNVLDAEARRQNLENEVWWATWHRLDALCCLRWTPVKRVEPVVYAHEYVYDFTVPGPETFLAGWGGFFVHNTFTVANVIAQLNRPVLVLSHNKTLAAQLYGEFKQFFPHNAVEYFISYYDYYQPEAYIATTNTYIEKDLAINQEIDKLRLSATSALMSGRRDVLVVASVSCIYGMGNPEEFRKSILRVGVGEVISRNQFLYKLVEILYSRTEADFQRGSFRVKGDTVDINLPYADFGYRVIFFGDEVEAIQRIDTQSGKKLSDESLVSIFPANLFVTGRDVLLNAIHEIQDDLVSQIKYFEGDLRLQEADRIKQRTEFDMEMMRELGYCSGIENYSRYFDRRLPGQRPFCLLDFFPDDYLLVVDESHATMPQIRAMWGGDRSRKEALVDYGFRLPSALDNRPLTFQEFEALAGQTIFVSATPADYELRRSEGVVVEQIIRPTGLLDPEIEVRPSLNQIDDLLEEIHDRVERGERVLVTTLTKRMAEELSKYLDRVGVKCRYIHSEVKTLERVEILRELRLGVFDVLVGVNLLREGLDLPEVSLVAIMDADKEGFLRDIRSLIQTIGRAARNDRGKVLMYADTITGSMQKAIDETNRRRTIQMEYNEAHGITPKTVFKSKEAILEQTSIADVMGKPSRPSYYAETEHLQLAADPVTQYMTRDQLAQQVKRLETEMERAAKELDFLMAAKLRDEMLALKKRMETA